MTNEQEAPQMVMDTGNAEAPYRLETEPERIARIKKAQAAAAPKPKVSPVYAPVNGDRVIHADRKATVIGTHKDKAYVRYTETRTQARVDIADLTYVSPGIPEAALIDPALQATEAYTPGIIQDYVEGSIPIALTGAEADKLIAKVLPTRAEAAAEFAEQIIHVGLPEEETHVGLDPNEGDWSCEHTLAAARVRGEFPEAERILAELEAASETAPAPLSVSIRRTHPAATIPTQARHGDAGYDLTATEGSILTAGARKLVGTGIEVAIPHGYVGLIMPRSGLAHKSGIAILGGVIDAGYRGEVKVILLNTNFDRSFAWSPGDRIAQLVIQPVAAVAFEETDTLPDSERNAGGFGSTGQ